MSRIALVPFVPELRYFEPGQRERRPQCGKPQLFGKGSRQIGRYRCDAVGPRSDEHCDNEAGHTQHDIFCCDFRLHGLLHHLLCRMAGIRCHNDDMARSAESGTVAQRAKIWVILAGDTEISIVIEVLTSQPAGSFRIGAERQVGLTGLKLRLEMPGIRL